MTTVTIDNGQDIMDSRDVIARIDELKDEILSATNEDELIDLNDELKALEALAEEASGSPDWPHGETLIRDTYFQDYAEQLADDIGAIPANVDWPLTYIDWPAATDALKQDYMSVDFDGVEYWIRA